MTWENLYAEHGMELTKDDVMLIKDTNDYGEYRIAGGSLPFSIPYAIIKIGIQRGSNLFG